MRSMPERIFGVVTDNLDAVFVAADRAVGAESVELATDCVLRGSVDFSTTFSEE